MLSRVFALAVMLMVASAAWAQPAKAEAAAADADAAMERAKRAAAGPLKAIQQASKIRRRPGEGEAVAPAAPAVAASAAPGTRIATVAAAAPAPSGATPSPAAERVVERAAERAEPPAVERVLPAEALEPTVTPVAAIVSPAGAPATAVLPAMAVAKPLLTTLPLPPRVISMVEPNIPERLMAPGTGVAEVEAELQLRADGSVAEVTLVPPVPRAWQRYITTALEQWRFEPGGAARTHRVRLVFNSSN